MMLTPKIEAERLTCTDRFSFLFFLLVGDKNKNSLYSIILFIIWILLCQTDRDCGEKKKKKKKKFGSTAQPPESSEGGKLNIFKHKLA